MAVDQRTFSADVADWWIGLAGIGGKYKEQRTKGAIKNLLLSFLSQWFSFHRNSDAYCYG